MTGGIAILKEDNTLELHEIPLIAKGHPDFKALAEIFRNIAAQPHFAILENVHAIPGAGAMQSFNFGQILGAKKALLASLNISHALVAPKIWQKTAWVGVPDLEKNGKRDTKAMSLIAATRLFPNQKFFKSKDGLIDASLMAFYSKATYNL